MNKADKQLLVELDFGIISKEYFLKKFSVDIKKETEFVKTEIKSVIDSSNPEEIEMLISLIWLTGNSFSFLDELNELLVNPNHSSHQVIAKELQNIANPKTIPFIRKALETNFDYLEYTCSESDAIAKWFSHLLFSIGTDEAFELMKEYSNSKDIGVAKEMKYRLTKVKN